ncbi:TPPP family protein CG45057-like [Cephus cinctus]|uniref:TPPP family protein CG45057-like n=1 Tax=Cephus cinctus TaxID=211228 RepID=A0AAJ7RNJ8_CEPCN|nr:TPPP family protein CG45057-like [Cephus cinctus]
MATFESQFIAFSKFGDTRSDGTTISLSQSDKWMKQAKVIDKNITTTDTAIAFNKLKQKTLSLEDYNKYINDLANTKNIAPKLLRDKMASCGLPGTPNTTQPTNSDTVSRLTDTTNYTGSHKERFDESGKGRGKEGRTDASANDGYVQGYKHKDTYDEKHTTK